MNRRPLVLDVALYGLSAGFAAITAATSTLLPHRAWGSVAWIGYAAAAVVSLGLLWYRRRLADCGPASGQPALGRGVDRIRLGLTGLTFATTAGLPLVMEAVQRAAGRPDRAQEEVLVIEAGGQRLLDSGTPYLSRAAISALPASERLLGYLPYQPGMAIFGLPRAVGGGWWTDARVWFAAVTVAAVIGGLYALRTATLPALVRAAQAVAVLPICALTLATGGDDLPVLALSLLACALAATGRWGWAGLAVGVAGALKLFAWPVALVLLACAIAQRFAGRGGESTFFERPGVSTFPERPGASIASERPSGSISSEGLDRPGSARTSRALAGWPRFVAGAAGLPILVLIPPLLIDTDAAVENVLRYPTGHGVVISPAQSPLLGQLIAAHLPGGRLVALALLGLAALAIAAWLIRRPPRTLDRAAAVIVVGLLAAIVLLPTTRFGYLLYPAAFAMWIPGLRAVRAADGRHARRKRNTRFSGEFF